MEFTHLKSTKYWDLILFKGDTLSDVGSTSAFVTMLLDAVQDPDFPQKTLESQQTRVPVILYHY